jgi:DNA polymerase-1
LGELAVPEPVSNLPPLDSPELAPLAALLSDASVPKAGDNIKYDWQVLRRAGVELAGVAYDSMLASFVLDPGRRSHALDTLSLEHLGRSLRLYSDVTGRGKNEIPFAEVPVPVAAEYASSEGATVLALERFFAPSLAGMGLERLLHDIELPLVEVLTDMEWTGIRSTLCSPHRSN